MKDIILFSGPWIREQGSLDHRIVLHAHCNEDGKPVKYIVHTQYWRTNDTFGYESGFYFEVGVYGDRYEALTKAMDKFFEVCANKYTGNEQNIVYSVCPIH